ncbi:MAG TPA: T9SS type A sorting domain-containing protein [Bacteroidia bacterium]|nr:T9SS type A sorting domain-containing protein [Bacteroidia bacterium]
MKKFTKLCFFVCAGFVAFATQLSAQISITGADMPVAGSLVVLATDSTSGYTPGSPSATGQSWNFSALNKQKTAKVSFMAPSATAYASKFPGSNLADSTIGTTGFYFFTTSGSQFAVEGSERIINVASLGVSFQIEVNLNPLFVQSVLPATYNTTDGGVSNGHETFSNSSLALFYDSEKVVTQITYTDTVDAFGTMTTPTGTYNVLRQNHHEVDIDSLKVRSTSGKWSVAPVAGAVTKTTVHQYNWYSNSIGYILVQMNMDSTSSTVKNVIWDTTAPAGINELSYNGKVSVFPNPCANQITFQTFNNGLQYINIYDVAGRKVEQDVMKNGTNNVNTTSYAPGMYLYTMTDKNGNVVDRGKFMVK